MKLRPSYWAIMRGVPSNLRFITVGAVFFGVLSAVGAFIPATVTFYENGVARHPSFAEYWQKGFGPGTLVFSALCFAFAYGVVRAVRWMPWVFVVVAWSPACASMAFWPDEPYYLNTIFSIIMAALVTRYFCFSRSVREYFSHKQHHTAPSA